MNRYYIVSVGTSFIANYNRSEYIGEHYDNIDLDLLQKGFSNISFKDHNAACNQPMYNKYWESIKAYIQNELDSFESIASSCAELSSILYWKDKKGLQNCDHVLLIATNTPEGVLSANILNKIINDKWNLIGNNNPPCNVQIEHRIQGLGNAQDLKFGTQGLPNFLHKIISEIENNKDKREVILVPTGGYKALIPYMVIGGILEQVPNRYVYEESKNVLELPPLPLHVDVPSWIQVESVLEVLDGQSDFNNKKIFTSFQNRLSGLITKGEDNRLHRTGLDQVFQTRAAEIKGEPELVVRARNSPLLAFLEDEKLRERFLRLTSIGHLIWKGDRVPEMVDHGLRHHNDLFLLAERILLPIFYYKEDFLSEHELFALLCALFLHDCGHVIGWLDINDYKRRLLPTEIRDHHHVLGYLRLKEIEQHGGTAKEMYNSLKINDDNEQSIWEGYLHAVAILGLYHRKKMKIEKEGYLYDFFGQNQNYLKSLLEHLDGKNIVILDKIILFERAALLVSLLRIIDGLDEQASRTGTQDDVNFHLSQLDTEKKEEWHKAEDIKKAITYIPDCKKKINQIESLLKRRLKKYALDELKDSNDKDIRDLNHVNGDPLSSDELEAELDKIMKSVPQYRSLFDEYIHSYLKGYFKLFQKGPYREKQNIKNIKVEHCYKNDKIHILFVLEPFDDSPNAIKKVKELIKNISKEYYQDENENQKNQNQVVKKYLNHNNLYLHYGQWNVEDFS